MEHCALKKPKRYTSPIASPEHIKAAADFVRACGDVLEKLARVVVALAILSGNFASRDSAPSTTVQKATRNADWENPNG